MSANSLVQAARTLSKRVGALRFSPPVSHVYNPLEYAWAAHEAFLRRFGEGPKEVLFLGMNPGPFGMMQTGVPFGEVAAVRDWMGIRAPIVRPAREHPKRPIDGFDCARSEVSGRRLWGWAAARFGTADAFFARSFVLNYCPLVFLEESGRNRTPEQLPASETGSLYEACDRQLRLAIEATGARWLIGVGGFAARQLRRVAADAPTTRVAQILHPSPASPAANRGWSEAVDRTLDALGVFAPGAP